jgi:hypothetical protein
MATMECEMSDLAGYATVEQTAAALGPEVSTRRVRNWQTLGLLVPATRKGLIQFRLTDVIRCSVLLQLQAFLGQDSPLAVEIARGLTPEHLAALLVADDPRITVRTPGRESLIGLDPEELAVVHERLAAIPR